MVKKWMGLEKDRRLLETLYIHGPLSAKTVILIAGLGGYGYKRLWHLKKQNYTNSVTYAVKVGKRKRIKKAAIYYLTRKGSRYIQKHREDDITPVNMKPREKDIKLKYLTSQFLHNLFNYGGFDIESGKEIRKKLKFPNNVSLSYLVDKNIAVHIMRPQNSMNKKTVKWLINCMDKLKMAEVAKYNVIIVSDRSQRIKLVRAMLNYTVEQVHILLPEQVHLIKYIPKIPDRFYNRLKLFLPDVEIRPYLFNDSLVYKAISNEEAPVFGNDASTFSIEHLKSISGFDSKWAQEKGYWTELFVTVEDQNDIDDIVKLFPNVKDDLLFSVFNYDEKMNFWREKMKRNSTGED